MFEATSHFAPPTQSPRHFTCCVDRWACYDGAIIEPLLLTAIIFNTTAGVLQLLLLATFDQYW